MYKTLGLAFGGLVLIGIVFLVMLGFSYNGFINTATNFEVAIKAQYTNNQNVYDNGYKKVKEMAQVPQLQEQALEKLFVASISARQYDKGGQLMKFIQEQNPTLDQSTFVKIQQAVESYRNAFQNTQTELIAKKQSYETFLTATTSGRFNNTIAGMLGSSFPRIDLNKFDIVTSDKTQKAFETKRDEPLDLLK
jgi:hypothetical protein